MKRTGPFVVQGTDYLVTVTVLGSMLTCRCSQVRFMALS